MGNKKVKYKATRVGWGKVWWGHTSTRQGGPKSKNNKGKEGKGKVCVVGRRQKGINTGRLVVTWEVGGKVKVVGRIQENNWAGANSV